jgi:hypothetical protein
MSSDSEIVVRKRKFRVKMGGSSYEESRAELEVLKEHRNISPATKVFFETMIERFEELEMLEDEDEISVKRLEMTRLETLLQGKLAKDAKYHSTLKEFRLLTSSHLLLRYGDYLKQNLHYLKKASQKKAKESQKQNALAGTPWGELDAKLKKEKKAAEEAAKDPSIPTPDTPITNLIEELAPLARMTFNDAQFHIEQYDKRCKIAHSGIDLDIENNRLVAIATYIVRDQQAIENGVLVSELEDMKEPLLRALELFKSRFFDYIYTEIDEAGVISVYNFDKSADYRTKEEEMRNARIKKAVEQMKVAAFDRDIQLAREITTASEDLLALRDKFLDVNERYLSAKAALKEANLTFSKIEVEFKEVAIRFRELFAKETM